MIKKTSLFLLLSILIISCKKETVQDAAPSLIGNWKHYSAQSDWHIIHINADGTGTMEWYANGELLEITKSRTWYFKDNTIYFGKIAWNGELYEVLDFPSTSIAESIQLFDTLKAGKRFMKLDKGYYTEFE